MKDPITVIAEIGVNHNGDIKLAKECISAAANSGANIVKFQTFISNKLVTKNAPKAGYQKEDSEVDESQLEMLEKLELSVNDHYVLKDYAENLGLEFLSSAFDIESLEFLETLNPKRIKIPSGELNNYIFLREVGRLNKPTILSTGMSTIDEVCEAIKTLQENGLSKNNLTILQCNTQYPTPPKDVNLAAMKMMQHKFNVKVGLSDHTIGTAVAIAAASLGATLIEKHLTLNKQLPGPDHKASLEPKEFKDMVENIRIVEDALGSAEKIVSTSESKNRLIARKSIVALKDIKKGELFSEENLTVKRPGNGISPMNWQSLIGKKSNKDYFADELIDI